ncbi:hypothetical protein XBLMG947_4090 [Xanthomonas bromi]|uniref:Uncharacterized protein n=1 Tax=Xanthomonas bromi TaxID=56449 RepID=A0A1C3NS96_9XANT|nr:hypothetical protein [Xanthomonas bromi]SBV53273.1 hypothetical protein XBLMG947_4090 [Xanthomonas bromi]
MIDPIDLLILRSPTTSLDVDACKCEGVGGSSIHVETMWTDSAAFKTLSQRFPLLAKPNALIGFVDLTVGILSHSVASFYNRIVVGDRADQQHQAIADRDESAIQKKCKKSSNFVLQMLGENYVEAKAGEDHPQDANSQASNEHMFYPRACALHDLCIVGSDCSTSDGNCQGPISPKLQQTFKPVTLCFRICEPRLLARKFFENLVDAIDKAMFARTVSHVITLANEDVICGGGIVVNLQHSIPREPIQVYGRNVRGLHRRGQIGLRTVNDVMVEVAA